MSDRTVYVMDRDNVARPLQKSVLLKQLQHGNLSERILISHNGEHFDPLGKAEWFFEDEHMSISSAIPPSPVVASTTTPLLRSISQPLDTDARRKVTSAASFNRLKPSFKGSLFPPKVVTNSSRSLKFEGSSPSFPVRTSPTLGLSTPGSFVTGASERLSGRAPGSPRSLESPAGELNFSSLFSDKPDDIGNSLKALTRELSRSLARAECLHSDFELHFGNLRATNEDLLKENARLRAMVEVMRPIVAEHAPTLLEHAPNPPSIALGTSSPPQPPTVQEEAMNEPIILEVPYEADSPMLRDRMDKVESDLDIIRQSIKSCVKSGQSFVQGASVLTEQGLLFADDLRQSPMEMLNRLGEAIGTGVENYKRYLDLIELEFLQPLARFANNDMKSANHIRAELERKRENFENVESRHMSSRRGRERGSLTGAITAQPQNIADGALRRQTSGAYPPFVNVAEDPDKKSLGAELRVAEAQYELSRCRLIHSLNYLQMNRSLIVNRCVLGLAESMAAFHDGESGKAHALLEKIKPKGLGDSDLKKRCIDQSEQIWQRRKQEIEGFHFEYPRRSNAERDLIYEGWLWKRSSNVMRDWKKRFFQVIRGQLVYFRNSNKELDIVVVCDMHLCSVRETPRTSIREGAPPRSSFEVISPKRSHVLMASSEEEKDVWISSIRAAIETSLGAPPGDTNSGAGKSSKIMTHQLGSSTDGLPDFVIDPTNSKCFDCHGPLDPSLWVSINLGVFICINCASAHRSMGTHVSKVRSLSLDKFTPSQLDILRRMGNTRAAKIWEAKGSAADEARGRNLAQFVKDKYEKKLFLSDATVEATSEAFESVLVEDNLKRVAWFVAHGSPPFYVTQRTTALHIAASEPSISAALCEFLLLNGAEIGALDENGKTPSDIANEKASHNAQTVLRMWAAGSHIKSTITEDV